MKKTLTFVFAVGLLTAACGGGSEDSTIAAAPVVGAESAAADEPAGDTEVSDSTEAAGGSQPSDPTGSVQTDEELAISFAQCMRAEGVDFPDPVVNADGSIDLAGGAAPGQLDPTTDTFGAAAEVCGPIIEGASFLPGADIDEAEQQDRLLAFAQCLRGLGHDVIDPILADIQGGGPGALITAFGPNFRPQDPANADAVQECQAVVQGSAS